MTTLTIFTQAEKLALIEIMTEYGLTDKEKMGACYLYLRERFNRNNHNSLSFEAHKLIRHFMATNK